MKFKLTKLFVLVAGVALMFTACKKSSSTSSGVNPQTPKQVSSFVALNLSSSLFGSTGVNLSGGAGAASTFAVHTKGKVLNDLTNPQCGQVVDTTLSYTQAMGDTSVALSGNIKFSFSCVNSNVNGFTLAENLDIKITTPQLTATNTTGEAVTLLVLDPTNSNSDFTLTGTLNSNSNLIYKTSAGKSGTSNFAYKLGTLTYDPNAGDVISGSASFTTSGSGASGTWNYAGTITYLGNHVAKVTINGFAYTVNTETGVVS